MICKQELIYLSTDRNHPYIIGNM